MNDHGPKTNAPDTTGYPVRQASKLEKELRQAARERTSHSIDVLAILFFGFAGVFAFIAYQEYQASGMIAPVRRNIYSIIECAVPGVWFYACAIWLAGGSRRSLVVSSISLFILAVIMLLNLGFAIFELFQSTLAADLQYVFPLCWGVVSAALLATAIIIMKQIRKISSDEAIL